jgi:hypothetical protein
LIVIGIIDDFVLAPFKGKVTRCHYAKQTKISIIMMAEPVDIHH